MKQCSKCKLHKKIDDFYFRSDRNTLRSACKTCTNKPKTEARANYEKTWREANKIRVKECRLKYVALHTDEINEYRRNWNAENKDKVEAYRKSSYARHKDKYKRQNRACHLMRKFGITVADYDRLLNVQEGKCAICRKESGKTFHVDHCHKTGKVRGLLCVSCNRGIGYLGDDVDRLYAAIYYLRCHDDTRLLRTDVIKSRGTSSSYQT